jgi:hypothetical protein
VMRHSWENRRNCDISLTHFQRGQIMGIPICNQLSLWIRRCLDHSQCSAHSLCQRARLRHQHIGSRSKVDRLLET